MSKNFEILLGLTTTTGSDWVDKVREINEFNIEKIALFPTFLEYKDREKLYNLLENSCIKEIPHVHLRSDMEVDEVDYILNKFNVKYFNIHPNIDSRFQFNENVKLKFKDIIYIENSGGLLIYNNEQEIKELAGICIDFAHFEDDVKKNSIKLPEFFNLISRYKIGCAHISAVKEKMFMFYLGDGPGYDDHKFKDLFEFDYLKKYEKYFPEFLSLELENSFKEQLKVKEYIEDLFNVRHKK